MDASSSYLQDISPVLPAEVVEAYVLVLQVLEQLLMVVVFQLALVRLQALMVEVRPLA